MENNTFFVIEIQDNETGKTAARAEKVNNKYNLVGLFAPVRGFTLLSVNACDTWKEAQKIADFWNQCARQKNNCMY